MSVKISFLHYMKGARVMLPVVFEEFEVAFIFFAIFSFQYQGRRYWGAGGHESPLFCVAKRKKGNKGKKERLSKQKLLKGCHQGQNVTVLAILERLEFKKFSGRPTMVADNACQCSMAPPF